ncbi:MAG TPA: S1 RNA-binding domain-containing protein, partial [Candidatus Paceibacterota bacterium]
MSEAEIGLKRKSNFMEELLKRIPVFLPRPGDLVEGKVIGRKGAKVFIDLGPAGSGIVFGREFLSAREIIRNLKPGDKVAAKVVEIEGEDGCVELSLKEAGEDLIWKEAEELSRKKETLALPVLDANKGGLVLEWKKIKGFLPASQLKISHYPRVEGGDKDKILEELKKFVGENLNVTVIAIEPKEGKIIFSEKGAESEELRELAGKYQVGGEIEGEVTGVVDFGIFVKLEEGLEGLSHLSELDWSLVQNPNELFKVGERVRAKIIGIDSGRVSLSVKALKPDPWMQSRDKYKKGDIVEGKVLRFNKYG